MAKKIHVSGFMTGFVVAVLIAGTSCAFTYDPKKVPFGYHLSGEVSGAVVSGVMVNLTGATKASTTTGRSGSYSFSGLANGTYAVAPSMTGFTFSPLSMVAVVKQADVTDQNFTATSHPGPVYGISGTISGESVAGVVIALTGDCTGSTVSDSAGGFSFEGLPNGTYTLTPALPGYEFAPASIAVSPDGNDVDGQNFTAKALEWVAVPSGTTSDLWGIWGSSSNDVWAVGVDGTILHWNGSEWAESTNPTSHDLFAVWGTGPSNVWVVGDRAILLWNGVSWTSYPTELAWYLLSVWGSGPDDVWTVGYSGTILHNTGNAWESSTSGTTSIIRDVWSSGPNDTWVVGGSIIMRRNADSWETVANGPSTGIWGSGPGGIWVVGAGGTIAHGTVSGWESATSGTTNDLMRVWGSGTDDIWAVGNSGTIVHGTASGWAPVTSGTANDLMGVWGSGSDNIWVVGRGGTILRRQR